MFAFLGWLSFVTFHSFLRLGQLYAELDQDVEAVRHHQTSIESDVDSLPKAIQCLRRGHEVGWSPAARVHLVGECSSDLKQSRQVDPYNLESLLALGGDLRQVLKEQPLKSGVMCRSMNADCPCDEPNQNGQKRHADPCQRQLTLGTLQASPSDPPFYFGLVRTWVVSSHAHIQDAHGVRT